MRETLTKTTIWAIKSAISSILLSLVLFTTPVQANAPINQLTHGSTIAPMLKATMPAVVSLLVQGEAPPSKDPFHDEENEQHKPQDSSSHSHKAPQIEINGDKFVAAGSGVIIDAQKGLIVTNAHVVDQAKSILVTLSDGRRFLAKKIGSDDSHDIALLKIFKSPTSLHLCQVLCC